MNGYRRIATVLFSLSALCGCAHDKLLRLETQDYVKVAEKTEASGRAFYDGMIEGDRALWAELYAIDGDCTPLSLRPSRFSAKSDDAQDFCEEVDNAKDPSVSQEIDRGMFDPQYAALAFLHSYLTALASASADPELRAAKEFKAAAADLALLGKALKTKSLLDDGQVKAVSELIDFAEALSKEQRSAKEIRAIVSERRDRLDAAFDTLIEAMKKDASLKRSTEDLKQSMVSYLNVMAIAQGNQKEERRRRLMSAHYARVDADQQEARRIDACNHLGERNVESARKAGDSDGEKQAAFEKELCEYPEAGAMFAAKQANRQFVELALEGRMSAKQKARLIKMQRENFMRAVSIFIDVTTAF